MRQRLVAALLRRNMERIRAGDYRPTLRMDAGDVHFRFPGDSSWSGEIRGKDDLERWLQRFVRVGLQIYADEVVVKGWPWKMTLCIRGTDHLDAPSGERVYENRYVIWGHLRWFKLKRYEVYEDTQKTVVFDRWLVDNQHAAAAV
jgi:ketosteroid isomerase-like protein